MTRWHFFGFWLVGWALSVGAEAALTGKVCKPAPSDPSFPVARCTLPPCPEGQDCSGPAVDKGSLRFGEPYFAWKADCRPEQGTGCWAGKFPFFLKVQAVDPALSEVGVTLRGVRAGQVFYRKVFAPATQADASGYYGVEYHLEEWVPVDGEIAFSVDRFCARDRAGNETCALPKTDLSSVRLEPPASPENTREGFVPPAPPRPAEPRRKS